MSDSVLSIFVDPDSPEALEESAADYVTVNKLTAVGFAAPILEAAHRSIARIDLNRELIRNPVSTYMFRFRNDNSYVSRRFCLVDGDVLIVDRSLPPRQGDLAIVVHARDSSLRTVVFERHKHAQVWGRVISMIREIK